MALSSATMTALRVAANGFGTRPHEHYLAIALQSLLATRDPIAMLRLLQALWGSSYAWRDKQREALDQVGLWIEDRLDLDPRVEVTALALEIGWLRRLSRAVQREPYATPPVDPRPHHARTAPPHASATRGQDASRVARFGKRLEAIKRRRNAAPPLPPPDRLPPVFEAELVDPAEAREARKTTRAREKRNKPPKDRWLPVRPTDPRLANVGSGLVLSITHAVFEALFTGAAASQGAPRSFHVTSFAEREGKKLIVTLTLTPPAPEAASTPRSEGQDLS